MPGNRELEFVPFVCATYAVNAMTGDVPPVSAQRENNVRYGDGFLDSQLDFRNQRKDKQEGTAKALVVAAGALMTILVALSEDTGVLVEGAPVTARVFLVLSLVAAVFTVVFGAATLWPRKYDRMGAEALDKFNSNAFLDQDAHQVIGETLGAKITVAKKMDVLNETKGRWLKAAFVAFVVSLAALVGQAITLAADPPPKSSEPKAILVTPKTP